MRQHSRATTRQGYRGYVDTALLTTKHHSPVIAHINYRDAWAVQRSLHADVAAGTSDSRVLYVEHEGVYTAGRRTRAAEKLSVTPIDVDRGGKITWHGPGQLVAYPIVRLSEPVDVVAYVRALEHAVMATCSQHGVPTKRVEGRSGVWIDDPHGPDRKVCAIGVRVSRGVSMHGLALNCTNLLEPYRHIVPCGITDAGVTTLSVEAGHELTTALIQPTLHSALTAALGPLRIVNPHQISHTSDNEGENHDRTH